MTRGSLTLAKAQSSAHSFIFILKNSINPCTCNSTDSRRSCCPNSSHRPNSECSSHSFTRSLCSISSVS